MEYRLGNVKEIEERGSTVALVCPKCKNDVNFSVFTNGEKRIIPKFPIIKSSKVYFLVCPKCSSVFGVEESAGKAFSKGQITAITEDDLKELNQFNV